tara:strand:- start:106 stop:360 length:255 start_codon:yes stop_codon:yes gene_type:complete
MTPGKSSQLHLCKVSKLLSQKWLHNWRPFTKILAMRRLAILISKSSPALAVRPHYICAARNDCYCLHQQIRVQLFEEMMAWQIF